MYCNLIEIFELIFGMFNSDFLVIERVFNGKLWFIDIREYIEY